MFISAQFRHTSESVTVTVTIMMELGSTCIINVDQSCEDPLCLKSSLWHQTQISMPSSASWQGRRLPINTPGGHLCPAGVGLQWGQFGWPVTVSFCSEDTQPVPFLLTQHSRRRHSPEGLGWLDTHGTLCQHYKVSQSKGMLTQPSSPCGWTHPTRVFFQLVNNNTILHMVKHSNVSNRGKKR